MNTLMRRIDSFLGMQQEGESSDPCQYADAELIIYAASLSHPVTEGIVGSSLNPRGPSRVPIRIRYFVNDAQRLVSVLSFCFRSGRIMCSQGQDQNKMRSWYDAFAITGKMNLVVRYDTGNTWMIYPEQDQYWNDSAYEWQ